MNLPVAIYGLLADLELQGDYDVLKDFVMPGFRPGIHDLASGKEAIVDGRAKLAPGPAKPDPGARP